MLFRLGSAGDNPDTHAAAHSVRFDIDEGCLQVGVDMFTQFVLDHMNGIEDL
jgi:metal-dependent amidase/aminoacylase/carboxypeptidase family protein